MDGQFIDQSLGRSVTRLVGESIICLVDRSVSESMFGWNWLVGLICSMAGRVRSGPVIRPLG